MTRIQIRLVRNLTFSKKDFSESFLVLSDSGIQSVGDSIRGSSDSMGSNPQAMDTNNVQNLPTPSVNVATPTSSQQATPTPFVSMVQQVFGGKMQTTYKCNRCNSISLHKELFTELHLAIPEEKKKTKNAASNEPPLTVNTLVTNYLEPEALEEDNKYHCDKCGGLQDAVKTIKVLEGPSHLLCTLMRFKYDRTLNRKSKVFTDIQYQLKLALPVDDSEDDERSNVTEENYELYAIVVHSGYSSDGGHYYTYAREPKSDHAEDSEESTWYTFNDSKVSFSSFEDFMSVTKRFPRDVAYQLFYRKQSSGAGTEVKVRPLRADLKMAVEKDNLKLLREKERSSSSSSGTSSGASYSNWKDDGSSGGGGAGCGGGGFNSPGRLVC